MRVVYRISLSCVAVILILTCGCVERELTIESLPAQAYVELNDEHVGLTPVTVPFNWYGTYRVRLEKEGYQTLSTNKKLDRPANDFFPFDLFREIFAPDAIDTYRWEFELQEHVPSNREELILRAKQAEQDSGEQIKKVWEKLEADAK
jgi:hypothetical protein